MKLPKETEVHGRWYGDACGTAFGLELIGERWALLVVRELMFGARRFSDLRASLPGISAKVLTERLGALERHGVLTRRKLAPPGAAQVYELTEWGYRAEPLIQEIGRWAAMSAQHDPTLPLSPASLMLSMRTMLARSEAAAFEGTVGFDIAGDQFVARLSEGELAIRRGLPDDADAKITAPAAASIAAMLYAAADPAVLESEAGLSISGKRLLALRFAKLFRLPDKLA